VTVLSLSLPAAVLAAALISPSSQEPAGALPAGPETFAVTATISAQGAATGAVTVPITIQIDRYTPEFARTAMMDGLRYRGGYPGFLRALREAPAAGFLEVGGNKFVIRWAHQELVDEDRRISIVTEKPVHFIGSGRADAKPTAGYEVAVAQLTMHKTGRGEGTMAAAARVKPRGTTEVQIDDYAQAPVKLTATTRAPQ
jgi:hypothetical protein